MLKAETQTLLALFKARRHADIERLARELVTRHPDFGFGWKSLAAALQFQGKDALAACRRAVELLPREADTHLNLGNALWMRGEREAAARSFRRAIELAPDLALAHANLGNVLRELGQTAQALESCRRAVALNPAAPMAHVNLGVVLQDLGRLDEAAECLRHALTLAPELALAHANLGNLLRELGQVEDAVQSCRQASALNPRLALAHANLGVALEQLGQLDAAMAAYRRALALEPDSAKASFGLGLCHLLKGELRQGWPLYEFREHTLDPAQAARVRDLPRWRGEPVHGEERLLVLAEQGFGDSLQFARYLPLLAQRFAGVGFVCPAPLTRLLRLSMPPRVEIVDRVAVGDGWNRWTPLLSLPGCFGTTLETIPADVPYLRAEPGEAAAWHTRILKTNRAGPNLGFVWAGSAVLKLDARRSIAAARFAPLLERADVSWFSLQKGPASEQAAGLPMIDWMSEVEDFAATAALVSALDLVIAVDTAVLHLAGALGKPVWLLNRYESEWRWMRNRDDSPWYPRLRIFSQRRAGDWDEVVARIDDALDEFAAARRMTSASLPHES